MVNFRAKFSTTRCIMAFDGSTALKPRDFAILKFKDIDGIKVRRGMIHEIGADTLTLKVEKFEDGSLSYFNWLKVPLNTIETIKPFRKLF